MRILAVDDEPGILRICERVLSDAGHSIACCENGDEACARLGEGFDLVLTDLSMPGSVRGEEVMRRGRESGAEVVCMTANPDTTSALAAVRDEACGYLLKPFGGRELMAVVGRCEERRALRESERALREQFGRFADPEIVRYSLEHAQDRLARGERRVATVLFADVRGFTPFAQRVEPERAVLLLNEALGLVVEAVRREGGLVNKFVGDGLMAVFGAPLDRPDQAAAALRAALSAREALESLAEMRANLGHDRLRMGFGINTGEVVAGCLGTKERAEYTVIGHPVNLAARLESAARAGQILIGPETAARAGEAFQLKSAGALSFQGVPLPVEVFEPA